MRRELDLEIPGWQEQLTKAKTLLKSLEPKVAQWTVVPFLESYHVLADELAARGDTPVEEAQLIPSLMKRGEEYRLRELVSADSVSTVAFKQALALATNRQLLGAGVEDERQRFASEVGDTLARATAL